jgi:hypothetical protein
MPYRVVKRAMWWCNLCVFFLIVLHACRTESVYIDSTISKHEFSVEHSWQIFKIENEAQQDLGCNLNINKRFFQTTEDLIRNIRLLPSEFTDEHEVRKAWRFVKSNLQYNIPLTEAVWIHQPTVIFNSLGFGQCDDLAAALAFIWKEMGYEVRVWNLNGHVVPEVLVADKWQMYDPSYDVYYLNDRHEVAGFEELCKKPSLVSGEFGRLEINNFRNLAELNFKVLRYADELKMLYSQGGTLVTEWHLPPVKGNMSFFLPAGGSMMFPVNSPSPVIISNWKGLKRQLVHYMRITIPKGWKGNFFCPLIISSINGSGTLVIDKKTIPIHNFALQFDLNTNRPVNQFFVKEALTDIEVYALINSGLFNLPGRNVVTIEGAGAAHLNIRTEKGEAPYPTLANPVMDHRYQALPGHFIRYEKQKDSLQQLMFSNGRPLQTAADICTNAESYFSLWHEGSATEKKERSSSVCEKMQHFYHALPEKSLQSDALRFMSDPLAFIMLIYILEEYPEYTLRQVL